MRKYVVVVGLTLAVVSILMPVPATISNWLLSLSIVLILLGSYDKNDSGLF